MRILLAGVYQQDNGPSNVNKEIIRNKTDAFLYIRSSNRCLKFAEGLIKLLETQVLVVSGTSRIGRFLAKAGKALGKKVLFIMHGCASYEVELEGITIPESWLKWERELLEAADFLLPISRKYSLWVQRQYPQYAKKVRYWCLGVNRYSLYQSEKRDAATVAVAGGDRKIKNNIFVSNAIERLGGKVKLRVYGSASSAPLCENKHTEWMGELPHEDFITQLKSTGIFVVNSTIESFNISVMEALSCGCSILVSDQVGAAGLLELQETDIIYDTENEEEISRKILFLIDNPNNQRICAAVNWEEISWHRAVQRLEEICAEIAD